MSNSYRIIIKGHLDPDWNVWFGELDITFDDQDNTVLAGHLPDQPALHAVLDSIRDLNLTLISAVQIDD